MRSILRKHLPQTAKVGVFGSRAYGKPKKFSDLDLVIDNHAPISLYVVSSLSHEFEESNLPFKVDLVDWAQISDQFKKIIKENYLPFSLD